MLRTHHRRAALVAMSSLFVAGAMILALLSPLGIHELVAVHHTNWERLSFVGQTYGVVSALLDAAALVGVVQAFHSLSDSGEANRLNAYVSLLIQNLQMLWDSRDIEEDELRSNLADLLVTEAGRHYWQQFGHVRMSLFTDRRRQQEFVRIIDEVSRAPGRAVGAA